MNIKLKPLVIAATIVTVIYSLPLLLPKKKSPTLSDKELREMAIDANMLPTPKDFQTLLRYLDSKENRLTKEKIELGKRLFFDTSLSRDKSINCASCHILNEGGDDNIPTAIGVKNRENPFGLNSPTVLNSAFAKNLFWNGRVKTLKEQAKGPIQAHFEMDMSEQELVDRLKKDPSYLESFDAIFSDGLTFDNIAKAIEAYEKTLLTRGSYDRFIEGDDDAINQKAKRGLSIFLTRGCKGCHNGISVGGGSMQKFPLRNYIEEYLGITFSPKIAIKTSPFPFENEGGFLGKSNRLIFRVPILRNITKTSPYFHNGAIKDIKEAVRIMSKYQLGDEFSKDEIESVVEFLKTLEGNIVEYDIK
jgi:cytochrome c peroxidase